MVPSLGRSWVVWACAALFFCYQFVLRVSPSIMTHELMADFCLGACDLGILISFFFYAYVGLQLPVGVLLDKFSPRRLLILAALGCTGGSLLFASAETLMVAAMGRFLIGTGAAFGFLSCMKLGALWFPPQRIAMVVGLTLLLGFFGATLGSYPLSFLVDALGWRQAILVTAGGGVFIAVLVALVVRDHPPKKIGSLYRATPCVRKSVLKRRGRAQSYFKEEPNMASRFLWIYDVCSFSWVFRHMGCSFLD